MRDDQIALQLYTVRRLAATDLAGTLRGVREAGFRAVELAGLPEVTADALRAELDAAGLEVVAAHQALDVLRADRERTLDRLLAMGCRRVIVPWLPEADRSSSDAVRRVADELGRLADACHGRAMSLGYHNHDFEFAPLDGFSPWDILLTNLPDTVEIELDVYWASIADQDPVALIGRLRGRVKLLHMKDMAPGPDHRDAPPGDGVLPWASIVDAGRRAGVAWYIVEQDEPSDPLVDAARGLSYLRLLAESSS